MIEDDKRDAEQDALNARLEKLNATLKQRQEEQLAKEAPPPERSGLSKALSVGLNAFSEFAGAVLVGGLIGWKADEWLGTKPWLMIVLLGLGIAAGFWNIYRVAKPKA
ncbi:AtpZ/AtpI family protein [Methylocystis parvus]|uniref:AtpZ/AtpI family protein n=1 Tax=Methylocystis parvus TaxID=134 RepID=UPI003C753D1A